MFGLKLEEINHEVGVIIVQSPGTLYFGDLANVGSPVANGESNPVFGSTSFGWWMADVAFD